MRAADVSCFLGAEHWFCGIVNRGTLYLAVARMKSSGETGKFRVLERNLQTTTPFPSLTFSPSPSIQFAQFEKNAQSKHVIVTCICVESVDADIAFIWDGLSRDLRTASQMELLPRSRLLKPSNRSYSYRYNLHDQSDCEETASSDIHLWLKTFIPESWVASAVAQSSHSKSSRQVLYSAAHSQATVALGLSSVADALEKSSIDATNQWLRTVQLVESKKTLFEDVCEKAFAAGKVTIRAPSQSSATHLEEKEGEQGPECAHKTLQELLQRMRLPIEKGEEEDSNVDVAVLCCLKLLDQE